MWIPTIQRILKQVSFRRSQFRADARTVQSPFIQVLLSELQDVEVVRFSKQEVIN